MLDAGFNNQNALAFIYVIDPPGLLSMAIPLLLSIRHHHPNAKVFPYCPAGKLNSIPDGIVKIHEEYNAPITELTRRLEFSLGSKGKPYRHGNKILAAAERRETDYCIFLDTDTYISKPLNDPRLFQAGKVAVVPESVAGYAGRNWGIWDATYGIFNMETPAERVTMLRTTVPHPPYFNAGFISFPEMTPSGRAFGEVWLDTALAIDRSEAVDISHKRPWLDQAAIPVAVLRSECNYEVMEKWFNYPLDSPTFPPDDNVKVYHYHSMERLDKTSHMGEIESYLKKSGYWNGVEDFFYPLRESQARRENILADIFRHANIRREISKKIKVSVDKMEQQQLKAELRRLKNIDLDLRKLKSSIVEEHFYDRWSSLLKAYSAK